MKKNLFKFSILMAVFMIAGFNACQKDQVVMESDGGTMNLFTQEALTSPYVPTDLGPGGNYNCEDIEGFEFEFSSGRINYEKVDGEWKWEMDGEYYDLDDFPFPGVTVTVTNGTYVAFTTNYPGYCVGAVIVKGGPTANVYIFENGVTQGFELTAPINPRNNQPYGLSNITFCFVKCDNGNGTGETAFGGDYPGSGPAWWYYFDTEGPATQAIYAGQKLVPGATVTYEDGTITIVLGPNMDLQDGSQTVKIQGYGENELPKFRPAAGLFTTYKGSELVIDVPDYRYFVIHLDVIVYE